MSNEAVISEATPEKITGLILAGGRGLRMDPARGGVDKGMLVLRGQPLVLHALRALQPQVSAVLISANRNHDRYAEFGVPVIPDALHPHSGPLTGVLAGLFQCTTEWLAVAPCDAPGLPADFVRRLANAAERERSSVAVARCATHPHWTHLLIHRTNTASIGRYLADGHRRVGDWCVQRSCAFADFEDPRAFDNLNTPEELRLEASR